MLEFNDGASQNVVMVIDVEMKFSKFGDRVVDFNIEIRDEELDMLFFHSWLFRQF